MRASDQYVVGEAIYSEVGAPSLKPSQFFLNLGQSVRYAHESSKTRAARTGGNVKEGPDCNRLVLR